MTTELVRSFAIGWITLVCWSVIAFSLLERVRPRDRHRPSTRRVLFAACLLAIDAAIATALVRGFGLHGDRVLAAWLVAELFHYALHRAMHRVPVLWRIHRFHHDDVGLDWTTAWRVHPIDAALTATATVLAAALVGGGAAPAAWFVVGRRVWTLVLHANIARISRPRTSRARSRSSIACSKPIDVARFDRFLSETAPVYLRMSIPSTMRSLQQTSLEGPRGLALVTDTPVPRPGRGEILIRVVAAGVNFVDVARGRGSFGDNPQPPFIAGFEAVGEVVATGEAVAQPGRGALVACAGPGAFAEYVVSRAAAAMPVPPGWTAEQALGLVVNWPAALAAMKLGRVAAGETVLVLAAAGATGQAAVKLAKRAGARVIGAASLAKHEAVRAAGADQVLDSRALDLASAVLELTGGRGADVVVESAGGATFAASLAAAKRITGRVVVLGLAGGDAVVSNWELVYRHPIQILGFNLGTLIQAAPQLFGEIVGELHGLIAAGIVGPARVTTYALADGARALTELEDRATVGKLALLP